MASRKLKHGTLTGRKCPHCPMIVQPGWNGRQTVTERQVAMHLQVVHPAEYAAWLAVGGPEAGQ